MYLFIKFAIRELSEDSIVKSCEIIGILCLVYGAVPQQLPHIDTIAFESLLLDFQGGGDEVSTSSNDCHEPNAKEACPVCCKTLGQDCGCNAFGIKQLVDYL